MNLNISAEKVLEIVKEKITKSSSVISADDIEKIKFDYDNMTEKVVDVTVVLKRNSY